MIRTATASGTSGATFLTHWLDRELSQGLRMAARRDLGLRGRAAQGHRSQEVSQSTLKSLGEWQKLGIVRVNGEAYPRLGDKATLFAPEGVRGPSFLVLNNFRAILHYNTANSYALAVGHLADGSRAGTFRSSLADR